MTPHRPRRGPGTVRRLRALLVGERGSATIEAVIVVPAFLLFIGLIIVAGRLALAHQAVQTAAADAARSASIARTQQVATADATVAARASLTNQSLTCSSTQVSVDVSGFAAPVGTPAQVTATVTCVVPLGDLSVPGIPGTRTVTATMTSPLDTYRGRGSGFAISEGPGRANPRVGP